MTTVRNRSFIGWAAGAISGAVLAGAGNIVVGGLVVVGLSLMQDTAKSENGWSPIAGLYLLSIAATLAVVTGIIALASGLAAWRAVVVRDRAVVAAPSDGRIDARPASPTECGSEPVVPAWLAKGADRRARLRARRAHDREERHA